MPRNSGQFTPIAIVGSGCVFPPDATDVRKFWHNLRTGVSGIDVPTADRWAWELYFDEDRAVAEKTYCRYGGFVRDYDFPARDLAAQAGTVATNRTQQFALDACYQALAHLPGGPTGLGGQNSMLVMSNMLGDELWGEASLNYRKTEIIAYLRDWPEFAALDETRQTEILNAFSDAVDKRFLPLRTTPADLLLPTGLPRVVAGTLGITGPSFLVDGACAGGLMVVDTAVRYLHDHSADVVVAVAVMANMAVTGNVAFAKIGGLSPTESRPLDTGASGLIPSEGAGAVILKRLDDALAAGDRIQGVIRGVASRTDGKGKAIYAPNSRGQVDAMRRALGLAGWTLADVDHVETHATATLAGDKVELASLLEVAGAAQPAPAPGSISVGSVKGLIGHAFPAAGMANLIKILTSLEHEEILPTHRVTSPQPQVSGVGVPFVVHGEPVPWPADRPRRALANAFGFGGVNASICVEGYDPDYHGALARSTHPARSTHQAPTTTVPERSGRAAIVGVALRTAHAHGLDDLARPGSTRPGGYPVDRGHPRSAEIHDPRGERRTYAIDFQFPWREYRIPPDSLKAVDRAQQLALVVAGQALKDAGGTASPRTAVVVGACAGLEAATSRNLLIRAVEYEAILAEVLAARRADGVTDGAVDAAGAGAVIRAALGTYISPTTESALPGYMDNIVPGRIGNMFDLRAANIALDAGRASFPAALDLGLRTLRQGECDQILVGGVSANLSDELILAMAGPADKAPDPAAGPRSGVSGGASTVPAEAAVFFLLKPVEEVTGEDRVYAIVDGVESTVGAAPGQPVDGEPDYFGAVGAVLLARALAGGPDCCPETVPVPSDGDTTYTIRLSGARTDTPAGGARPESMVSGARQEEPATGRAGTGASSGGGVRPSAEGAALPQAGHKVWRGLTPQRVDEVLAALAAAGMPPEAGGDGDGTWDLALSWSSQAELTAKATAALGVCRFTPSAKGQSAHA